MKATSWLASPSRRASALPPGLPRRLSSESLRALAPGLRASSALRLKREKGALVTSTTPLPFGRPAPRQTELRASGAVMSQLVLKGK
jgi:hypothetical protein